MKFKLKELLDIKRLQEMTDELYKATGIPSAIIDMDGEILTGSGWQRICTDFHRKHPEMAKDCVESDLRLRKELDAGEPFVIYKCPRGLVDASSPVIIEGEHVANVFTGQLFNETPDASTEQFFREQARKYGLDEEEYIKAYREIPVMTGEQYRNALSFLAKLAQTLADMGLTHIREREASARLLQSEQLSSTLLSRMNEAQRCAKIGNWELDIVSGKVWWSAEMYRIFELQPAQYTPDLEANARYIHPDDLAPFGKAVEAVIRSGDTLNYDIRIITGQGNHKYCNFRGKIERSSQGTPLRFFGTFMDITDHRMTEEQVRNSEERLQRAELVTKFGNWEIDLNTKLVISSEGARSIYGVSTPTLSLDMIQRSPLPEYRAMLDQALQDLVNDNRPYNVEFKIKRESDGSVADIHSEAIYDREHNRIFGVLQDITERKQHEAELRRLLEESDQSRQALLSMAEDQKAAQQKLQTNQALLAGKLEEIRLSEERYRTVVNTMSEGIILQTASGEIITSNARAERILGLSADQIKGRTSLDPVWHTIHEDGAPFPGETHPSMITLLTGKPLSNVIMGVNKPDGTLTWISINSEPIFVPGATAPHAVVTTFTDITERKRGEEVRKALETQLLQAQKMESVGTLAGGIAHDFNNILMALIGYADSVYEKLPDDSDLRHDQEQVMKAALRAKELVQQILTFSRRASQEQKPIKPGLVIKEALKLLRASIPATIEIRQQIPDDIGTIMADPTAIHQIVINLCTNAYHAMREKGGVMCVTLRAVDIEQQDERVIHGVAPGRYILMEFNDTGTGIEKDLLGKIFDPYFTTKKTGEGTGLGLSVVHGIVKSIGGQVTVYSEPDKGSTFRVYIPRLESIDKPAAIPEKSADNSICGTERLLVVDDEEPLAELYRARLGRLGYQVTAVTSSEQALELFRTQPDDYDIVVTDMTMPRMTGMELALRILSIKPGMPIILCTGFSDTVNGESAKAAGIREYVTKPITPKDIARLVRNILDA